ncbi:hypothetical protein [Bosea sp. R86505]|uniref:hypothetical protein n=1 Tax=Bosea sp. R86505 TaxID=3101710 RepID=UPI0036707A84
MMMIEGSPERFAQGLGRPLRLVADRLRPIGGFALRDGQIEAATRIEGHASLVADRLMRAGYAGEAHAIALTIRPLAKAGEGRALLLLSFREGGDPLDEAYHADIYAPAPVFEALCGAVSSGAAQRLLISAMTNLWARESDHEAAPGLPVTWHLGLEADGRGSAPARGLVESLEWHSPVAGDIEPAPSPEEEPGETTADGLGRIAWSLKQIALVLMFLLIVVALK